MLYGAIFGCLSPILSISAFLSYKSPFVYPKDEVCLLMLQEFKLLLNFSETRIRSMYNCFDFQGQNVERAKLALLTDKVDGPSDPIDVDRQSDHLLMMTAYRKWEKILHEVSGCLPYLYLLCLLAKNHSVAVIHVTQSPLV